MAMIDQAYSTEMQRKVNLIEAEKFFQEGKITNQTAFICIGTNCDCPMMCANLAKPKKLRKRDPYFRVHGYEHHHSLKCGLFKRHYKNAISDLESDTETEQQISDEIPDTFNVDRPRGHEDDETSSVNIAGGKIQYLDKSSSDKKVNFGSHNYHHLGTLVSGYLDLRKKNQQSSRRITIEGRTMSYGKLFKRVGKLKKPLNDSDSSPRYVYFSDVQSAVLTSDNKIIIFLKSKCDVSFSGTTVPKISSAITIDRISVDSYRYKRDIVEKIQKILTGGFEKLCAYVYAAPVVVQKPTDESINIINFEVENLDLVEFKFK